jgi:hypothetical protein
MKKPMLTTLTILLAISPFVALAGDIYWNAKATFHNDAKFTSPGLQTARGTATITYNETDKWTVTLKFSGLLKNYNYVFQFGVQDQLLNRYDYYLPATDARGRINMTFTIENLDSFTDNDTHYLPEEHNPWPDYKGYTILRLLDLEGKSGGKLLTSLEPNEEDPDDNPYCVCPDPDCDPVDCEHPNATMVMRARQDGKFGSLEFLKPRDKKK